MAPAQQFAPYEGGAVGAPRCPPGHSTPTPAGRGPESANRRGLRWTTGTVAPLPRTAVPSQDKQNNQQSDTTVTLGVNTAGIGWHRWFALLSDKHPLGGRGGGGGGGGSQRNGRPPGQR